MYTFESDKYVEELKKLILGE
ncbi:Protein of unknown function [Bacillus cereus]|nr:Protein of unknown function [Bacillus mobilis]SCN02925.1 Protein of unknown function [Bacillus cereus]